MSVQHHSQFFASTVAAGLAVAAFAAPAALARPIDDPWPPAAGDGGMTAVEPEPTAARAPVMRTLDPGFDWGSAAIGAGTAGGLVVIVTLGGLTYTGRRRIGVAR